MEGSTKAIAAMAEIMMAEMGQVGMECGDIRTVEMECQAPILNTNDK